MTFHSQRLKTDGSYSIKEGLDQEHTTILTTEQRHNTLGLRVQDRILKPTGAHAVQEQLETGGITTGVFNRWPRRCAVGKFMVVSIQKIREVTEIDINRPSKVKTDTCPRYFRRVLKLI